jgi:hypothetical protein
MDKNSASFILEPLCYYYSPALQAELHLIVVDDNGIKLGVVATFLTLDDGTRRAHPEAACELRGFELAAVVERIKKEIKEGKINKAFMSDITFRADDIKNGDRMCPELKGNLALFQYIQEIRYEPADVYAETDRINGLLKHI